MTTAITRNIANASINNTSNVALSVLMAAVMADEKIRVPVDGTKWDGFLEMVTASIGRDSANPTSTAEAVSDTIVKFGESKSVPTALSGEAANPAGLFMTMARRRLLDIYKRDGGHVEHQKCSTFTERDIMPTSPRPDHLLLAKERSAAFKRAKVRLAFLDPKTYQVWLETMRFEGNALAAFRHHRAWCIDMADKGRPHECLAGSQPTWHRKYQDARQFLTNFVANNG